MEAIPWTAIASLLISLLALGIAGLSLRISWRKERREVSATEPTGFAILKPVPDQAGWIEVAVRIENRSQHGWRCTSIDILAPFRAKAVTWNDAHIPDKTGNHTLLNPIPMDNAERTIPMDVTILRAGTVAPRLGRIRMGPGDDHSVTLYVLARGSMWSRKLSIRLNLSSMSPIEERKFIVIERTLPQAASTATA